MIPDILKEKDTVYHFTKLDTAIEKILPNQTLRLSPRWTSEDPIENTKPFLSYSSYGYEHNHDINQSNEIRDFHINRFKCAKQLCFCMNDIEKDYTNVTSLPYEYYGFIKPRMWDQYGEKYKGVCLAFSLDKLTECTFYEHGKIEYIDYNNLQFSHISIDLNLLEEQGVQRYKSNQIKLLNKIHFRKHLDYNGESEYRFGSYSNNEYDFLNFGNSLHAIIVSVQFLEDRYLDKLYNFAKHYGVDLVDINWHDSGVNISKFKLFTE